MVIVLRLLSMLILFKQILCIVVNTLIRLGNSHLSLLLAE
jgi:hypothetical protein